MSKFFVNSIVGVDFCACPNIELTGADANHIKNVLRLKIDDEITICTQEQKNYVASICGIDKNKVVCKIEREIEADTETTCHITIFQGLPKADKFEHIIQKCTELGVKEIYPVHMARTIVKLDEKSKTAKLARWEKIAETASKQCNRNSVLQVHTCIPINNIPEIAKDYNILIVPYEKETKLTLKETLKSTSRGNEKIGVVIGPEGGFEAQEIELLKQTNAKIVTLGSRILRTETVAPFITAILLYHQNEI